MTAGRWIYLGGFVAFGLPAVFILGVYAASIGGWSLYYFLSIAAAFAVGGVDPVELSGAIGMGVLLLVPIGLSLAGLWAMVLFVNLSMFYIKFGASVLQKYSNQYWLGLVLAALPAFVMGSSMLESTSASRGDLIYAAYATGAVLILPVIHLGIVLMRHRLAQPISEA